MLNKSISGIVLLCLLSVVFPLQAEIKARTKAGWNVFDGESKHVVSHKAWTDFLQKYVDSKHPSGINRMAYGEVKVADKQILSAYIKSLVAIDPRSLNKQEQFAYWLNLYNALTIELVLKNHPVDSIKNISEGWFGFFGPWDDELVTIAGEAFTLNDIEHRILRPIWRDPLIHYGVNCASLGCPNIQPIAYTGANVQWLLTTGAVQYVNHPRGVTFEDGVLKLSSIYQWYGDDFSRDGDKLITHLARYTESQEGKQRLLEYRGRIRFDYDWSLNKPSSESE